MTYFRKAGISMLVVTSLLATLFVAQTSFAQGKQNRAGNKCGTKWTQIFEGSADSESPKINYEIGQTGWELATSKILTYDKLDHLISNGCNFQIVKYLGLGGGAVTESYVCESSSLQTSGVFYCLNGKQSFDGREESAKFKGTQINFGYEEPNSLGMPDFNGKVYYIPFNEEAFTNITLKVYVRG